MIFDTHAHYDDEAFDGDREQLLSSMASSGVTRIVNVGAAPEGARASAALARKYDFIYAAIGIHPDESRFLDDDLVQTVARYYHALQENQPEEYSEVIFAPYHDYELNTLYEGLISDTIIVANANQVMKQYYGKDCDIALVDITNAVTADNIDPIRDGTKNMLITLAGDESIENFEEDLTALYQLELTRYLTDKGSGVHSETEFPISGEILYAAQYRNKWYVFLLNTAFTAESGSEDASSEESANDNK